MPRTRVVSVVGTRPNFMKIAPVARELERDGCDHVLVHTGQHYDRAMSDVFFEQLGIGKPDHMLGVGSGTHAAQIARTIDRLDPLLAAIEPDLVLVPGDVNSTLAAALAAAKRRIPIGHIEAGLRSFDRSMPEELNRIVTDQLADALFTHSPEANSHLLSEGRPQGCIHYVGNTMIDTLVALREHIEAIAAARKFGLANSKYVVVTLHRPALVDGPLFAEVLEQLGMLAQHLPVVFPVHPRTRKSIERLPATGNGLRLVDPLGYLEFMSLVAGSAAVLTDSGGIQEETTYLGVPCFTLRDNTERPITCDLGTNTLLGLQPSRISEIPARLADTDRRYFAVPPLWDGLASRRIVDVIRGLRAGEPTVAGVVGIQP